MLLHIAGEALKGLAFLHARQLTHGAVAPASIRLGRDGRVKLAGAGSAWTARRSIRRRSSKGKRGKHPRGTCGHLARLCRGVGPFLRAPARRRAEVRRSLFCGRGGARAARVAARSGAAGHCYVPPRRAVPHPARVAVPRKFSAAVNTALGPLLRRTKIGWRSWSAQWQHHHQPGGQQPTRTAWPTSRFY